MDRQEFRKLALAELDAVARLARHLAPRPQDADDLVQETCLRASRSGATYQPQPGGLGARPWLLKILHNVANDRLSAEQRQRELAEGLANHRGLQNHGHAPGPGGHPGDAEPIADLSELNWDGMDGRLKAAVEQLPLALRTPFLLSAVEGLRYRQIAEIIDVPVGTVMSRLYRARVLLSSRLADLAAAVKRDLSGPNPYPDLSPIGYRYVGAGPCPHPLHGTIHLLYRESGPGSGGAISILVQPSAGQFALEPEKLYEVAGPRSTFPMFAWRTERVVYFLLADDDDAAARALRVIAAAPKP